MSPEDYKLFFGEYPSEEMMEKQRDLDLKVEEEFLLERALGLKEGTLDEE